ncbi:hypothetical protein E2320_012845 [Naja naja]|nr:hypothetical protein E2320_012845 [Naja naja]
MPNAAKGNPLLHRTKTPKSESLPISRDSMPSSGKRSPQEESLLRNKISAGAEKMAMMGAYLLKDHLCLKKPINPDKPLLKILQRAELRRGNICTHARHEEMRQVKLLERWPFEGYLVFKTRSDPLASAMIFGSKYGEEPAEEQHHKANASHAHYYGRAKKSVQATRKRPSTIPRVTPASVRRQLRLHAWTEGSLSLGERDPFLHNGCKHSDFNPFTGMDTKQQNNMRFSNKLCLAAPMDVVLENKEIKHMKLLQWEKPPNLHLLGAGGALQPMRSGQSGFKRLQSRLKKNRSLSEVGFEPTPPFGDQKPRPPGKTLRLESGALDHSAILTAREKGARGAFSRLRRTYAAEGHRTGELRGDTVMSRAQQTELKRVPVGDPSLSPLCDCGAPSTLQNYIPQDAAVLGLRKSHTVTRQAHRKLEPDFHDKYGNLILLSGVAFGIGTWAYACLQLPLAWNLSPVGRLTPKEWRD